MIVAGHRLGGHWIMLTLIKLGITTVIAAAFAYAVGTRVSAMFAEISSRLP
jgi:hypothetical protein